MCLRGSQIEAVPGLHWCLDGDALGGQERQSVGQFLEVAGCAWLGSLLGRVEDAGEVGGLRKATCLHVSRPIPSQQCPLAPSWKSYPALHVWLDVPTESAPSCTGALSRPRSHIWNGNTNLPMPSGSSACYHYLPGKSRMGRNGQISHL